MLQFGQIDLAICTDKIQTTQPRYPKKDSSLMSKKRTNLDKLSNDRIT